MIRRSASASLFAWIAFVAAGIVVAWLSGRLSPHFVSDSPSYLNYPFESLESALRSSRMPGYPLFLQAVSRTLGQNAIPTLHVILHATAAWWICIELGAWGLSRMEAFVSAVAIGVGCTAMDNISTVATDAIAATVSVMATCALLRSVRCESTWPQMALTVALATLAIFIRPAYLFLIPWLLIARILLGWIKTERTITSVRCAATISIGVLIPLVAWMALRGVVVDDFRPLPFGHQNLAGVTVQLLDDQELENLPDEVQELGKSIVALKKEFDAVGPGFAEGEAGATMTIDARWDDMTYHVAWPAAKQVVGDDIIAQHNALAKLNRTIIGHYPRRYCRWLVMAIRRGAWAIAADIVMHPVFLLGILVAIVLGIYQAIAKPAGLLQYKLTQGHHALTVVAFTYLLFKLCFIVLTSPPIGRFSDAAAIFLPCWIAVTMLQRLGFSAASSVSSSPNQ